MISHSEKSAAAFAQRWKQDLAPEFDTLETGPCTGVRCFALMASIASMMRVCAYENSLIAKNLIAFRLLADALRNVLSQVMLR